MARCPLLTWRPVTIKDPYRPTIKPVRVNLHVAVSEAATLHGYFNQSIKNPDSHAYIRKDGSGEQYVDTARQAYADLEGNRDTLSVETQGGVRNVNGEEWTAAQCEALAQFIAWAHKAHGIPLKVATDSRPGPSSHGVSWHRLGIDGNFPGGLLKGRVSGGLKYSNARGKVCPGDAKIRQIPGIVSRAQQIVGGHGVAGITIPTIPEGHLDMGSMSPDELNRHLSRHAENVHRGVQNDLKRLVVPQLDNALKALSAVAGGDKFDEAKLKAGVHKSAEEGAREGVLSAQQELRDVLQEFVTDDVADQVVSKIATRLNAQEG